ncbi:9128_t:CDS:10 [Entrophospora sp. SA101]|nr:7046_t:CDS:10 [Entrophospora sp. SA101]CAJ0759404.1 9128_t:CDS:10 [Entrophospora sp. SA101]CAJ0903436.1 9305_t:CDS:10 [Entrophospora sp. SA101]
MAAPEEDYSSLPLTERVTHKIWKVRLGAYEELTKKFNIADDESDFKPFEGLMKNIATDANAVAQEAGLTTLLTFVEKAPNPIRIRSSVIPVVVDKGFGSSRTGTKNKAIDLILLFIEVDTVDPVLEDILAGLDAKQPKIVTTTVFILKEIIRLFGTKIVNIKPILKRLSKIFGHTDKNVRSEGTQLVIELYKWLGPAIDPHLQELKPVQLKEAFEKLPPEKPTQQRLLRSQKAAAEAAAEADDEAVDVLSKMDKNFYQNLGSAKWKERKEALDGLLEICKTPKIVDGNFSELISALAKRISDTNINIVIVAANIITALALGLRDAFAKYKATVISPLIEKLKEKKQSVIDALAAALDSVFKTITLSDIVEDVVAAGKHKNPQVKTESMKWLTRCLKTTLVAPNKAEIKTLIEMMVKASEDSFEPVRVAAFEGLGTIMKVISEKAMNPYLEGLDDIKKGKIKEFYEKAEVKAKVTVKKPPPPAVAAPSKPTKSAKFAAKKEAGEGTKKASAKKPPSTDASSGQSPKKPAAKTSAVAKKGGKAKEEEVLKYKYADENIEERFSELIPEVQTENLGDKNWKLRLAAIEDLYNTLDEMDPSSIEAELVFRFLAQKPGWKESNFQVLTKAFNIMVLMASKVPSFSKSSAALVIPVLTEKLGDIKLKKPAGETLTCFSEKISVQFVFTQAYEPLRKAKSPKIIADALTWFHGAIMEFGINGLQVRELIDFLKFALTSSNASVRTNAVTVLGALRIFIGSDIRTFVQDLNATQLATIDAEFERVADQAPPEPIKASSQLTSSGAKTSVMEELFPKVDIGALFSSKTIADCSDDKWKTRKEGLEQILAIVEANKRIKPNLGDLVPILKVRLADNNKSIQMMSLDICGKLATAMGKPFERHVKILVSPVTAILTDQKATVRGSAISALDCMVNATGLDPLVSSLATSLASENPLLRKDLLHWLSDKLKESDENNSLPDLSQMVSAILSCLQDRNGDVRKAAQNCLGPIVKSAGYDHVVTKCSDLKSAVKQTIMPMIESVRPVGGNGLGTKAPKLPPGLVLKPPASTRQNILSKMPTNSLLAQPSNNLTSTSDQQSFSTVPSNEIQPMIANRIPAPSQRGGATSGIGRGFGMPAPSSRLQFSRFRQGNGANGQNTVLSAEHNNEFDNKRDPINMEIDKPDHHVSSINDSSVMNSSPNAKQHSSDRNNAFVVEVNITKIMGPDYQQSVEALKELDKNLNSAPESILPHADEIVRSLALKVRLSYSQLETSSPTLVRLCKHLVNALVLLFSNKDLAMAVSQEALDTLLSELARRLLDPKLQELESGQQLSKALNVSMVKVLENSNRNATYSALISILEKYSDLRKANEDTIFEQTKFAELIMKCLWKLAKSVQENLKAGTLKPNQLLRDLNDFFLVTPPAEWKRRATEKVALGEMPLRTVKTLLSELITGLGEGVYEHLDLIEDPPKSYVYPYLHHMLEGSRKKQQTPNHTNPDSNPPSRPLSIESVRSLSSEPIGLSSNDSPRSSPAPKKESLIQKTNIYQSITTNETRARGPPIPDIPVHFNETQSNSSEPVSPASPRTPMTPKFPTPTNSARSSGSHEVELNARLTQIFVKIGTREETKQGIYELYEFQKKHPELESKVSAQLSRTGVYFQSYIKRGLANIAAEEDEKAKANIIAEAKSLFPTNNNNIENPNLSEDDAYKQKLLRLQQVFGYKNDQGQH